jgi:hypothetical protein
MNSVLSQALDAVLREQGSRFCEAFSFAQQLLGAYGQEGIAERIATEAAPQTSPLVVADLLSILFWSSSDNGASIRRTAEGWLEACIDEWKIQVALHLESYPFLEAEKMRATLEKVAARFPALRAPCEELQARRAQDERVA